ncbi:integrative conjugative element protein, RAQPRD family [Exercitatus varius]|uniref:integrative conjugative element protein, RAQPRD family n=1 Tax=Exercitatus varius TaxID=67857 RepID=UPI00294AA6C8|nr:RAQPRD family integrative conjugative element protein [Exercitatus varius]MDG2961716.1 RAQPRD family integrative conjugative element protein [Exercitatus varius]
MNTLKRVGKRIVIAFATLTLSISASATEQEQLTQAMKQLDAAKLSLKRALYEAATSPKKREYFDYASAERDINTIKAGINQYINPSRAIPRDPKAIRTLSDDYSKQRSAKK